MKKLCLCLMLLCAMALSSCGNVNQPGMSMATFSYEEEAAAFAEQEKGVNPYAFLNVEPEPVEDQVAAVERAKNECTIEYNTTSEYYDSSEKMWRVDFFTVERNEQGQLLLPVSGMRQSVYLDSNGITQLAVYQED